MELKKEDFKEGILEKYNVRYYLYPSSIDDTDEFGIPNNIDRRSEKCILKNSNYVCFSGLLSVIRRNKNKIDRMVYTLVNENIKLLSANEIERWIDLCIEARALPDYIKKESDVKHNRYIIKLEPRLTPSVLYIHLTCLRFIQEVPIFVHNILQLIDKYNMNFYLAWLVSSRMSIHNSWHNIVPYTIDYGSSISKILDGKKNIFNVFLARGLKNLLLNPSKFDDRSIYEGPSSFLASNTIIKASPKTVAGCKFNIKHITNKRLNRSIDAKTNRPIINAVKSIQKD
jgi:hypothetical protein